MNAISECEIESVRKSLYTEVSRLCTEADTLKSEYAIEKASTVSLTITEVKFFLSQLQKGNADDISYRKTLVNVFVNAIYLYDDKLVIFFNSGDKPVTIDDELLDKTEEGDGFVFGAPCSTKSQQAKGSNGICRWGLSPVCASASRGRQIADGLFSAHPVY